MSCVYKKAPRLKASTLLAVFWAYKNAEMVREAPSSEKALILPWCASTVARAWDRPMPKPPLSLLRELSAR